MLHLATQLIGHRETHDRFSLYTVGRGFYALRAGRIRAIDPKRVLKFLGSGHPNMGIRSLEYRRVYLGDKYG